MSERTVHYKGNGGCGCVLLVAFVVVVLMWWGDADRAKKAEAERVGRLERQVRELEKNRADQR